MNNNFKTRRVKSIQSLGEKLETARLRRTSLSLPEIAKKINVQKEYLYYLEAGMYDKLPADVYVHGYLKSYAKFLRINLSSVIKIYNKEKSIENKINNFKKDKKKFVSPVSFVLTPRMIQIFFIFLVVFGIIFYLWYQVSGLSRPPKLVIYNLDQDKTVKEETITVFGQSDLDSDLKINDQPIFVDSEGNFKETVSLQSGVNILRITATNRFDKETLVERKIMYDAQEEVIVKKIENKEDKEKTPSNNDLNKYSKEIYLTVTIKDRATWVYVKEDNNIAYSGTMLPDSKQEFKAKDKITLSSGKADTTYVNFNGEDLGSLGNTGEVIREMAFTRDLVLEN
jgi:cytoskeletal protein RodZ